MCVLRYFETFRFVKYIFGNHCGLEKMKKTLQRVHFLSTRVWNSIILKQTKQNKIQQILNDW